MQKNVGVLLKFIFKIFNMVEIYINQPVEKIAENIEHINVFKNVDICTRKKSLKTKYRNPLISTFGLKIFGKFYF